MKRSMKRSMISNAIKPMVNPDSSDSAITRYFAQLDSVLMSHLTYANTLVFAANFSISCDCSTTSTVVQCLFGSTTQTTQIRLDVGNSIVRVILNGKG